MPGHPSFDGVNDLVVDVDIVMVTPALPDTLHVGRGLGDEDLTVNGEPAMVIRPTAVMVQSMLSAPITARRRRRQLTDPLDDANGGDADQPPALAFDAANAVVHASGNVYRKSAVPSTSPVTVFASNVMFTYTTSGRVCGCDLSSQSLCSPCGAFAWLLYRPLSPQRML